MKTTAKTKVRKGKKVDDMTNVNAQSKSFDFLNDESELYTASDLRKKYVSR